MLDEIRFDDFRLDPANASLWRGQEDIHLTPKAFAVLHYLLTHHGQLVTKEQLLAVVWPDVVVGETTPAAAIKELRKALGDDAKTPRFIETVHRRGYRFIGVLADAETEPNEIMPAAVANAPAHAPSVPQTKRYRSTWLIAALVALVATAVLVFELRELASTPSIPSEATLTYPRPDQPSLAVLPFENLSAEPGQDYFADGLAEDLTTDLSKLRGLLIIAPHSSFSYKDKATDLRQIGQELGVRHILKGSVRRADKRIRLTAQLVDTTTGDHVWAQRYDRPLQDIFAVQDEIRRNIVIELEVRLVEGEQARVWRQSTDNPQAYDLFLQGRNLFLKSGWGSIREAKILAERALALDAEFVGALVLLGYCYSSLAINGESPEEYTQKAFAYAERALAVDNTSSGAYRLLAYLYFRKSDHESAFRAAETAVNLAPNHADNLANFAYDLAASGRTGEAVAMIQRAMRLNPFPPHYYLHILGYAYLHDGQYDKAIAALEEGATRAPDDSGYPKYLIIAYMEAGQKDKAQEQAKRFLDLLPHGTITRDFVPWITTARDITEQDRRLALLRETGLPE